MNLLRLPLRATASGAYIVLDNGFIRLQAVTRTDYTHLNGRELRSYRTVFQVVLDAVELTVQLDGEALTTIQSSLRESTS